ncbi:MAG TPA: fibronectin type III domain-containing protein [Candidatus Obscuribacterales bacterium]
MSTDTQRSRLLAALTALTLSACSQAPGPLTQPTPGSSPAAPASSAQPSVIPTDDATTSEELTVNVQADATLAGFAAADAGPFTLCLGQIASASTRLSLPAGLPEAALTALRSSGATVETADGKTTATLRQNLSLKELLAGIEFKLKGVPGGVVEGRTTFFNAAVTELGFVSWQADVNAGGKRVSVQLKAGADTQASESCPKIEATVSGANFLGAGGQVVSDQPLPNPVTTPSPSPSQSPTPAQDPAPAIPLNVKAVEQTSSSLTLQWEFPADARSFRLFLDGIQVASDYVTPNYYRFEGLRESTTYRLGVQSVNANGVSEIVTLTTATISGHSASGNFSGGGSSRPRPRPSASASSGFGDEFLISDATDLHDSSAVAMDDEGNFVVVWRSVTSNDGDIKGRLYDSEGDAIGSEFTVNSYTTGSQLLPDVAMDEDGDFVVVWASQYQDGDSAGIFGKRFSAGETAGGSEFRINSYTTGDQGNPAVAMDAAGDFVAVWQSYGEDGSGYGIFGRRFTAGSDVGGSVFQVNLTSANGQTAADVTMDADGDFVVSWTHKYGFGPAPTGVFARQFPDGSIPGGSEFAVTNTGLSVPTSAVAMSDAGDFTVVWNLQPFPLPFSNIIGKHYSAGATVGGSEFPVTEGSSVSHRLGSIAMDGDGDFIVTWSQPDDEVNETTGIFARLYSAGSIEASEFQVNVYTESSQSSSAVALDEEGGYVFTWTEVGHPLDTDSGIIGRLFH